MERKHKLISKRFLDRDYLQDNANRRSWAPISTKTLVDLWRFCSNQRALQHAVVRRQAATARWWSPVPMDGGGEEVRVWVRALVGEEGDIAIFLTIARTYNLQDSPGWASTHLGEFMQWGTRLGELRLTWANISFINFILFII